MSDIVTSGSIQDKIDRLYHELDEKKLKFTDLVSNGKTRSSAFKEVYGYFDNKQVNRLMGGKAGALIGYLRLENRDFLLVHHIASREERLRGLSQLFHEGMANYQTTGEAAHGAVAAKAVSALNAMTGENAPEEYHHIVTVTHEQLQAMTDSQRTDAYKRMMSNKLRLVDVKEVVEMPDSNVRLIDPK